MISSVFYLKIINNDDKYGFTGGQLQVGERGAAKQELVNDYPGYKLSLEPYSILNA
jgi:hypothetical protein